jgi:hypothetical protein
MAWWQWTNQTNETVTRSEFDRLVTRVEALEQATHLPMIDQARLAGWYHRDELGDGGPISPPWLPWVSKTTRFTERLTSTEFVWATLGQAGIAGLSFTILGAGTAWLLELPWFASPVIGAVGFALAGGVLLFHNREMLHRLVMEQTKKGKQRAELRVQIDFPFDGQVTPHAEFLYLRCEVKPAQLAEFARAVLNGSSLAVHVWTGAGGAFTRAQYDSLMSELVKMDYIKPSTGNQTRSLNRRGLALMKALAGSH